MFVGRGRRLPRLGVRVPPQGQSCHQHYITNHAVELDGDKAHAETYYLFVGTDRDPGRTPAWSAAAYCRPPRTSAGRWAIAARVCLVEWQTEATSGLSAAALDFLAGVGTVARNRTDASYDRPLVVQRAAAQQGDVKE